MYKMKNDSIKQNFGSEYVLALIIKFLLLYSI
jgi:hypothetical protein